MDDHSRHLLMRRLSQQPDFQAFLGIINEEREQTRDMLASMPTETLLRLQGEHNAWTRVLGWPRDAHNYLNALQTGPQDT